MWGDLPIELNSTYYCPPHIAGELVVLGGFFELTGSGSSDRVFKASLKGKQFQGHRIMTSSPNLCYGYCYDGKKKILRPKLFLISTQWKERSYIWIAH